MKIPALSPRWTFAFILLFGLLAMTARPATDPDLWWHLRTGQWIVETGSVPRLDPFSFTRAGHGWVSHEWLAEVAFYEIWRHLGFGGLIIFSAVITTAGFLLLYFRCGGSPRWAAAATALGALASAPAWGVRPQMFTFALASLLLWLLERGERRPWMLLAIPPMFLLWLNLHAGFALGPALMVAYMVGLLLEVAVGTSAWRANASSLLRILGLVVACLALVPLNPSGAQLYSYPFDTLLSSSMRSFIVEWFSPDFHEARFAPYLVLWLVLLLVLAGRTKRPAIRVLLPLILTAGLSLDAVRHIPIFVLFAVPVLATGIAGVFEPRVGTLPGRRTTHIPPTFAVTALVLMAAFAVTRWTVLIRDQPVAAARAFPEKAVAVLQAGNYGERLFAYYDWGGYAIFKLYPKYRVFVDGRADLYGDDLLHQFETAAQVRSGWRQVVDGWDLRVVLVPLNSALAQVLMLDPDWYLQYRDSQAVVLIRSPQSTEKRVRVTKTSPSG